jgi:hypothetical protein
MNSAVALPYPSAPDRMSATKASGTLSARR